MRRSGSLFIFTLVWGAMVVWAAALQPAPLRVVETYEKQCSSCHGQEGAMFEPGFEKKYATASSLREMVETMPGVSAMRSDQVDALLAYVRSISRGEAYLVWTDVRSRVVEGEVAPRAASVRATARGKPLPLTRPTPNRWRVEIPSGLRMEDVQITAQIRGKTSTLRLRQGSYTHAR